jgi:hypothetical protein
MDWPGKRSLPGRYLSREAGAPSQGGSGQSASSLSRRSAFPPDLAPTQRGARPGCRPVMTEHVKVRSSMRSSRRFWNC